MQIIRRQLIDFRGKFVISHNPNISVIIYYSIVLGKSWWTTVMDQPLPITDKEGMRHINSEVVHELAALFIRYLLYRAISAIPSTNMFTYLEVARWNPASFLRVEGMLWCCLDVLAVKCQMDNDRIIMLEHCRDRVAACFTRRFVVSKHFLANL